MHSEGKTRLIVYQILVRHLGNDRVQTIPGGNRSTNGCGTVKKLDDKALEVLQKNGFSAIWLTGLIRHATQSDSHFSGFKKSHPSVVKGLAGSPYAVSDFFETDPDLYENPENRWQELSDCLDRIHKTGMKAIVDFIPNHTAREYESLHAREIGLRDLGQNDNTELEFSPENHFYYLPNQPFTAPQNIPNEDGNFYQEFPAKATGNNCFLASPSIYDWYETVKLNYGIDFRNGEKHFNPVPPVWNYMKEVLLFWASKGFDGFRCDMAEMVPVEFWTWVLPQIKKTHPHLFFIAEVYEPHRYPEFIEAGFDYLYDKVGMYDVLRELVEGKGNCDKLTSVWQAQEGFGDRMLRFLENHDEQRIASDLVGKNPFHALPAMAITALFGKGPVMVYAGQELGEKAKGAEGYSGDDGKTSIFDYGIVPSLQKLYNNGSWNDGKLTEDQKKLQASYAGILHLAASSKAITEGGFFDLQYANPESEFYPKSKCYAFLRHSGEERILVLASFLDTRHLLRLILPKEAWMAMNCNPTGLARLVPMEQNSSEIEFYTESTYDANGGTPGIAIRMEAWSFRVFQIVQKTLH